MRLRSAGAAPHPSFPPGRRAAQSGPRGERGEPSRRARRGAHRRAISGASRYLGGCACARCPRERRGAPRPRRASGPRSTEGEWPRGRWARARGRDRRCPGGPRPARGGPGGVLRGLALRGERLPPLPSTLAAARRAEDVPEDTAEPRARLGPGGRLTAEGHHPGLLDEVLRAGLIPGEVESEPTERWPVIEKPLDGHEARLFS